MKTFWIVLCACAVCCGIVHRRVLKSLLTGSEMPKAPKWHVWVKPENRRS